MASILMSAFLVACGAAAPSATGDIAEATRRPLVESPIQPSPPPPRQPTELTALPEVAVPGSDIVAPTPRPGSGTSAVEATADSSAVAVAREKLAGELRVAPAAIRVIAVEEVQWPDGCLGVRTPGVFCTQVIVPGYRVTLEGDGQRYVYHTDQEGRQVVLAEPRP